MAIDLRDVHGFSAAVPRRSHTSADGELRLDLIAGVQYRLVRPVSHNHGHLSEMYRTDWGITAKPLAQVNLSTTFPGAIRAWGLHERTEDRLFVASGTMRIVCYDGRRDSATFGLVNEFFFNDRNQGLVLIPPGIYHGWKNIGDVDGVIVSMPSQLYDHDGPDRYELMWNDPAAAELIPYVW